jgi:predicted N-formylglutamate amidohydrolase
VTEALSEMLEAPAIFSVVSRLAIDFNRLNSADPIPEVSDGTVVPGNPGLSAQARAERIENWFQPYHAAVEAVFEEREARGMESVSVRYIP